MREAPKAIREAGDATRSDTGSTGERGGGTQSRNGGADRRPGGTRGRSQAPIAIGDGLELRGRGGRCCSWRWRAVAAPNGSVIA